MMQAARFPSFFFFFCPYGSTDRLAAAAAAGVAFSQGSRGTDTGEGGRGLYGCVVDGGPDWAGLGFWLDCWSC